MPIDSYLQSVENASFKISHPIDLPLRTLEKLLTEFDINKEVENQSIRYHISSFRAIKPEEYSPSFINLFPVISLAANKFNLEGVEGQANNWKEFGMWRYNYLKNGKDEIDNS